MGLSTVYGIVQQHHGTISCDSKPGRGTTFTVRLPAHAGDASQVSSAVATHTPRIRSGATILVVEDDDLVRPVVVAALTRVGYRVLAAAAGDAAIAVFREQRSQIRLLLTDLRMPGGMTGVQLAQQLRAESQSLPVIFMSGYRADLEAQDITTVPDAGFIGKPCTPAALTALVDEHLRAAQASGQARANDTSA